MGFKRPRVRISPLRPISLDFSSKNQGFFIFRAKQKSAQLVDISKLGLNRKIKKFRYSFICGKGYSPPSGRIAFCLQSETFDFSKVFSSVRPSEMREGIRTLICAKQIRKKSESWRFQTKMVEVTGFEPATFWSRSSMSLLHFIQESPNSPAYIRNLGE